MGFRFLVWAAIKPLRTGDTNVATTKTSKKNSVKKTNVKSSAAASAPATTLGTIPPVPAVTAPAVPSNFDPSTKVPRGSQPWATMINIAPQMAQEISSSPNFAADFGTKQDPTDLSSSLLLGSGWRGKVTDAAAWLHYVSVEDYSAWQIVLKKIREIPRGVRVRQVVRPDDPHPVPSD